MDGRKRSAHAKGAGEGSSDESASSDETAREASGSSVPSDNAYYSAHIASVCEAVNAETRAPLYSPALTRIERRREANRLSAKRCRKRRREEIQLLENEVRNLSMEQEALIAENANLRAVLQEEVSRATMSNGSQVANGARPMAQLDRFQQLLLLRQLQPGNTQIGPPPPHRQVPAGSISQFDFAVSGLTSFLQPPVARLPVLQPIPGASALLASHSAASATRPPQDDLTLLALLSSSWPPEGASAAAHPTGMVSLATARNQSLIPLPLPGGLGRGSLQLPSEDVSQTMARLTATFNTTGSPRDEEVNNANGSVDERKPAFRK